MPSCRQGIFVGLRIGGIGPVFLLCSLFHQALPVSAQNPSVEFESTSFDDAREGYVSLAWNELASATSYIVSDSAGNVRYRGEFPQAFISGLADGPHTFNVVAKDALGNQLAASTEPAVVNVRHWPMWQAMTAFGFGLAVFLVLVGVIIQGSLANRRSTATTRETV